MGFPAMVPPLGPDSRAGLATHLRNFLASPIARPGRRTVRYTQSVQRFNCTIRRTTVSRAVITSAPALVAGEWIHDGPTSERVGPYLQRVVTRAVTATSADVARAARYAPTAARAVARVSPAARADILDRAARLAAGRRDQLAAQLAVELGKPVKDGRGEIDRVADTLAVCAAEARRIGGELLPVAG